MNLTWLGVCNLLRNPVKLGFAPRLPGTFSGTLSGTFSGTSSAFSGTFSGTLLNLTGLYTKAPRASLESSLTLQSLPDLLWNRLRNPIEPDLALHQSLPESS
jgi:hypothetical protein